MSSISLPKLRKSDDELKPAVTSFDLLDGAFLKVARARLMRLLVVGAMALGIVGFGAQSMLVRLDASEIDAQREDADAQLATLKQQVAEEADTGGLTRQQMQGHINDLGVGAATVAYNDIPIQEVLTELESRTPGNVRITDISISPGATRNGIIVHNVSLTAQAPGYDTAFAYRDTLRASPFLKDVDLGWTGTEEQLTLDVTATLSPSVETGRSVRYRTQFAPDFNPASVANAAADEQAPADAAEGGEAPADQEQTEGEG